MEDIVLMKKLLMIRVPVILLSLSLFKVEYIFLPLFLVLFFLIYKSSFLEEYFKEFPNLKKYIIYSVAVGVFFGACNYFFYKESNLLFPTGWLVSMGYLSFFYFDKRW